MVNNLSFTLGKERLALVGESGSGKSMSARALMGLVRKPGIVSAKRLNVLGNDLLTLNSRRWQRCAATALRWFYRTRATR